MIYLQEIFGFAANVCNTAKG